MSSEITNNIVDLVKKRKSIRKYRIRPLSDEKLKQINSLCNNLESLEKTIATDFFIMNAVDFKQNFNGRFSFSAPHYLVICSEKKDKYLQNVGFMGQQLIWHLTDLNIGSCWLGAVSPKRYFKPNKPFVIAIMLGEPNEPWRQENDYVRRKLLSDVCNAYDQELEPILQTALLAPSATNNQPWKVVVEDKSLHVYRKKPGFLGLLKTMQQIDIGIFVNTLKVLLDKSYYIKHLDSSPKVEGYIYEYSLLKEKDKCC